MAVFFDEICNNIYENVCGDFDRAQLGGKDGKVAFVKRKNQVMASAVKSVLSQRTKRTR